MHKSSLLAIQCIVHTKLNILTTFFPYIQIFVNRGPAWRPTVHITSGLLSVNIGGEKNGHNKLTSPILPDLYIFDSCRNLTAFLQDRITSESQGGQGFWDFSELVKFLAVYCVWTEQIKCSPTWVQNQLHLHRPEVTTVLCNQAQDNG